MRLHPPSLAESSAALVFSEELDAAINAVVPDGVSHVGIVVMDPAGQVLMLQPASPSNGVSVTLPRVKREHGESHASALGRCLRAKVGLQPVSAYPICTVWTTINSSSFYFVGMTRECGESHAEHSTWCAFDDAERLLHGSKNAATRGRDLAVLRTASTTLVSPFRRVTEMIGELHDLGFGRIRAATWMHQNGYIPSPGRWTCSVVPESAIDLRNGCLVDGGRMCALRRLLHAPDAGDFGDDFTTPGIQPPFGWSDAVFDSPKELAAKFISRFASLCLTGWGSDERYTNWYVDMLARTKPFGVFYPALDEPDVVYSAYTRAGLRIPAPPPPQRLIT